MNLEKGEIDMEKRGNYYTITPSRQVQSLCLVFHGYAQLSKYFIRKFHEISNNNIIVAPEGTNYFYYGEKNRVVSSWMTSLYRERDIESNNAFLNVLFRKITKDYPTINTITVIGFSQGVSTALRWLSQIDVVLDKLILWAGKLPTDFFNLSRISAKRCYFVNGDKDQFKDSFLESKKRLKEKFDGYFEIINFEGGHVINQEVILKIFNK